MLDIEITVGMVIGFSIGYFGTKLAVWLIFKR
jgi:hypothetical protein